MLLKMLPVSKIPKENQFSQNVFIKMGTSTSNKTHEAWLNQDSFLHKIEYHKTYIFICFGLSTPVKYEKEFRDILSLFFLILLNSHQQLVNSTSYCHPDSTSPVSIGAVINENNQHRHTYIKKWGESIWHLV